MRLDSQPEQRAAEAYSTHDFRAVLAAMDCDPVIPSLSSWIDPPPYDKELYKARAEVECTFSLLKQARRRDAGLG